MPKRLTYDFVKATFNADNYTCLRSLQFHKELSKDRFLCLCPKGHQWEVSWFSFRHAKNRCRECAGQVRRHSEVEKYFNLHGYKLLSRYEKAHKKLKYECPVGHRHSISWTKFQSGNRCAYCAGQVIKHEDVAHAFELEGYTLLCKYKNSKTKMAFICPNGHCHEISWNLWNVGRRCRSCATNGYRQSLPGRLYYLRFEHKKRFYYKLGVTNRTIEQRYREEKLPYVVLMDFYCENGAIPFNKETIILQRNKQFKYKGLPFLRNGNSELFTKDILGLDSDQLSLHEILIQC
jgi:hypothetical protein